MGMFLSADLNQVINFQNDVNSSTIDIIDTYVYRIGLQTGEYSLATAAGLFKGVIGFVLIIVAHLVSKRLTGRGVWRWPGSTQAAKAPSSGFATFSPEGRRPLVWNVRLHCLLPSGEKVPR